MSPTDAIAIGVVTTIRTNNYDRTPFFGPLYVRVTVSVLV